MTSVGDRSEAEHGLSCAAASVVPVLAERLERAMGNDPWALGHRAAALAIAARLVDRDDLDRYASSPSSAPFGETVLALQRHLRDAGDIRGIAVD